MQISLAQTNPTIGDFDVNTSRITKVIERHANTDVFVFPELAISGYMLYDYMEYESIVDNQRKYLGRIAESLAPSQIAIVGGVGSTQRKAAHSNCAFIVSAHEIQEVHKKFALPTDDVFFETRYFEPSAGPTIHKVQGVSIALFICYDLWHKEHVLKAAQESVDSIVWMSASPYTKHKHAQRLFLAHQAVAATNAPLFMVNAVGANDEIVFDGRSFAMSKEGNVVHTCAFCEEDAQSFELTATGAVQHLEFATTHASHTITPLVPQSSPYTEKTALPQLSIERAEEICAVLERGLKDYLLKTRMPMRVHLGLSGGIDSALTAAIAVRALGAQAVTAILLPSQYTSNQSIEDAQALAEALKIRTHTLKIEAIFQSTHREFSTILHENVFDLTEENMQARIRGLLLMAYANKCASMLLTTGNKSEVAVGYCTLYGDMCGALNLIGDLYKTEVYTVAEAINKNEGIEIIPRSIMQKAPTAELRANQKDSDSLPAYPILDAILYEFIENRRTPEHVCRDPRFSAEHKTVERVWHLLCAAEHKRYQAAPIIKISERAFGRGRIMPIAAHMRKSP